MTDTSACRSCGRRRYERATAEVSGFTLVFDGQSLQLHERALMGRGRTTHIPTREISEVAVEDAGVVRAGRLTVRSRSEHGGATVFFRERQSFDVHQLVAMVLRSISDDS